MLQQFLIILNTTKKVNIKETDIHVTNSVMQQQQLVILKSLKKASMTRSNILMNTVSFLRHRKEILINIKGGNIMCKLYFSIIYVILFFCLNMYILPFPEKMAGKIKTEMVFVKVERGGVDVKEELVEEQDPLSLQGLYILNDLMQFLVLHFCKFSQFLFQKLKHMYK